MEQIILFAFLILFPFGQIIRIGIIQPIDVVVGIGAIWAIWKRYKWPEVFKYFNIFSSYRRIFLGTKLFCFSKNRGLLRSPISGPARSLFLLFPVRLEFCEKKSEKPEAFIEFAFSYLRHFSNFRLASVFYLSGYDLFYFYWGGTVISCGLLEPFWTLHL